MLHVGSNSDKVWKMEKDYDNYYIDRCVHEDAYGEEAKCVMDGHNCFRIYAIDRENLLITIELMEKNGDGGKHSSLSKGRISKKDKIVEKKNGWRVKKSINKCSISSLSTNDISPSLPHGKQISILPFNYPGKFHKNNNVYIKRVALSDETVKWSKMSLTDFEFFRLHRALLMFDCILFSRHVSSSSNLRVVASTHWLILGRTHLDGFLARIIVELYSRVPPIFAHYSRSDNGFTRDYHLKCNAKPSGAKKYFFTLSCFMI